MTKEAVAATLSPGALIATLPAYADDWLAILRQQNYSACYSPEYHGGCYASPQAVLALGVGWVERYRWPIMIDVDAQNMNFRASCLVFEALHAVGMDVRLKLDGSVVATLTGFTDNDNGSYKQAGFASPGYGFHIATVEVQWTGINPLDQLIDFQLEDDIINPTSLP